ncbi:MAG: hypothetical protein U0163_19790 [Gemmatimonadaceae bacterium]
MDRIAAVRLTAALAVLTSLACKGDQKGSGNQGPYAAEVATAVPKLERSTGLKFKTPPKLEERSREDVRAFLEKRFATELPDSELTGSERSYKRLGLLPDSLNLRKFMLDLLTEQVAGYYDPTAKTLYVVKGAAKEVIDITIQHELVHALQDQYINLDSLQQQHTDNDRQVAAQSVIEGQATLEQMGGINIASSLPGGWDRVRQLIRESQNSMPMFAAAPLVLQETLLFPYLSGAEFVRRFKTHYPDQPPFAHMPVSTEQVMHEDRFFGDAEDDPTVVTLPAPTVGKRVYENNLGEFETRLMLYEHLKDQNGAVRGAAGWDGDRFMLIDTGGGRGDAIAWVSVWDSSIDAAEFVDLLDTGLLKRYGSVKPQGASQQKRIYGVPGRTIAITTAEVSGRPTVLFVDVPAGVSVDVLNLQKVTLKQ